MTKIKRLAMAAVAVVMAGTMMFSVTACDNTEKPNPNPPGPGPEDPDKPNPDDPDDPDDPDKPGYVFDRGEKPTLDAAYTPSVDEHDMPTYAANTELHTSLGYEKTATGITYHKDQIQALGGSTADSATLAGHTYASGSLKPAWAALQEQLNVKFTDDWVANGGTKASEMIKTITQNGSLANYALITASADTILTEQAKNGSFLNINDYLYYMPNYKAFIDQNPVTRLSLTADTKTGAMYMLPYFDGNDDIEKYVLMRKDIVEKLLDVTDLTAATGTFAAQANAKNANAQKGVQTVVGNKSSVTAYMGTTAADNYKIAVTDPSVVTGENKSEVTDIYKTVEIVVDYGAALTAAKNESTPLGKAVKDAAGSAYTGASGNIVDLQNHAINSTNGAVTGAKLTKILQEYIKVAYHKEGETAAFYTKLSDVFNSAYAAWDVDLYVALGRCALTSTDLLGNSVKGAGDTYFLGSRTGYTNRTYDVASMAGELYGVRGLTSRYMNLFTYIDGEGNMHDARANKATWDALANISNLAKEGLYYTGTATVDGYATIANGESNNGPQILSSTDYVQTQTAKGGFVADGTVTGKVEEGYNYAPILTPVSRWDTDEDGKKDTVMRFTESWRGVKDGGFCVPKKYVENKPEKLAAVLAFIDYFYSNDGQILMTYGPQSTNGNTNPNGTWYATKSNKTLEAAKSEGIVATYDGTKYFVTSEHTKDYFCYKNELYSGTYYKGKQIPTLTTENLNIFYNTAKQSFTNHARYFLGSCLNLGIKDQGFEYQCTSKNGIVGSDIVAIALVNGTIKHTTPQINFDNLWYTLSPTTLPFSTAETTAMADTYKYVSDKGDKGNNFFYANKAIDANLLTDMMYYGYDTTKTIACVSSLNLKLPANADGVIAMLSGNNSYGGLTIVDGYMANAWLSLAQYYNNLIKK